MCLCVYVCVCVFTACLQTVTEWECFHYISEIQWIFFTSATGRHDRINKTCFHLIALQEKHSFVSSYNSQDNLDNLQFSTQYNGIDSDFRRNKFLLRLHIPKKCQTVFVSFKFKFVPWAKPLIFIKRDDRNPVYNRKMYEKSLLHNKVTKFHNLRRQFQKSSISRVLKWLNFTWKRSYRNCETLLLYLYLYTLF